MFAFTIGGKHIPGLAIVALVLAVIGLIMVRRGRRAGEDFAIIEEPAELIAA